MNALMELLLWCLTATLQLAGEAVGSCHRQPVRYVGCRYQIVSVDTYRVRHCCRRKKNFVGCVSECSSESYSMNPPYSAAFHLKMEATSAPEALVTILRHISESQIWNKEGIRLHQHSTIGLRSVYVLTHWIGCFLNVCYVLWFASFPAYLLS